MTAVTGDIFAGIADFPCCRFDQLEHGFAGGRLTAPALADQTEGPALLDLKTDAVDRMNLTGNSADTLRLFVAGQAPPFYEGADGTIAMNAIGNDIWGSADNFRFAHQMLNGDADLVEVGPAGVVEGWTWVAEPSPKHPFDHPFAFALIRPDGADTAMVHAVDAGSIEHMSTGMRVEIQFRPERQGAITDAYQPIEREHQITRQVLSILMAVGVGVAGRRATWLGSFIKVAAYNVQAYPIVAIAPILTVFPGLADQVGMDAFIVVVVGGFGSLGGALLVAIICGLLNSYGVQFVSQLAPVLMYIFMAIVLVFKPMGLFGERE